MRAHPDPLQCAFTSVHPTHSTLMQILPNALCPQGPCSCLCGRWFPTPRTLLLGAWVLSSPSQHELGCYNHLGTSCLFPLPSEFLPSCEALSPFLTHSSVDRNRQGNSSEVLEASQGISFNLLLRGVCSGQGLCLLAQCFCPTLGLLAFTR